MATRDGISVVPANEASWQDIRTVFGTRGEASRCQCLLDGEPVGWCAVEPRTAYGGLLRVYRVPWLGRAEDKTDDSVWAVTCVLTRAGFRKRGVSRALARAAVDFAWARGARALEAYPMITQPGQDVTWGELHVGSTKASSPQPTSARSAAPRPGES